MAANIAFTQGETVSLVLTLTNDQAAPITITGDTFEAKIKDIADLAVDLASFNCVVTDGANGEVTLTLTSADTLDIPTNVQYNTKGVQSNTPLKVYFYDVFRTKISDSTKRRVANGLVTVYPSITLTAT